MERNFKPGDILYVYAHDMYDRKDSGFLVEVIESYEGDEDLSYHGSPWYEHFVKGRVIGTEDIKVFGDQNYCFADPISLIKQYMQIIRDVSQLTRYI